jgi:hypothetical protein
MTNSEQIKEAPAPGPVIEIVADIDEKTHDQLQEFYEIPEEIKQRPDAELKMAQVMETLKVLGGEKTEAGADEKRESAKRAYAEKCGQAAKELADAFATLERWREFLPATLITGFDDAIPCFNADSDWYSDPDIMNEILPVILRRAFWMDRPDWAQ